MFSYVSNQQGFIPSTVVTTMSMIVMTTGMIKDDVGDNFATVIPDTQRHSCSHYIGDITQTASVSDTCTVYAIESRQHQKKKLL